SHGPVPAHPDGREESLLTRALLGITRTTILRTVWCEAPSSRCTPARPWHLHFPPASRAGAVKPVGTEIAPRHRIEQKHSNMNRHRSRREMKWRTLLSVKRQPAA